MGEYLTVQDIATRLEVTVDTVRRWLRLGELKGTPLGRAGYRVEQRDFNSFMDNRRGLHSPITSPLINTGPLLSTKDSEKQLSMLPISPFINILDFMELVQDAVIIRDPMSVILSWNDSATHLYGWTFAEAKGHITHSLLQTRFPHSREEIDIQLIQNGHWQGELVHIHRDGQQIIVQSRQILVRNEQGQPIAIIEINKDVTEQHRLADEKQLLAECNRLVTSSLDYETMLQGVAKVAIPLLADLCFFDMLLPDQSIRRVAWEHAESTNIDNYNKLLTFTPSLTHTRHPVSKVLTTGQPEITPIVDDTYIHAIATSPEHAQSISQSGIFSLITLPLTVRERTLGALTLLFTSHSGRHYTERDVTLAQEITYRVAQALDNARLFAEQVEARQQAEPLAALVENSSDFVAMASTDGRILYVNQAACSLVGLTTPEHAKEKNLSDFVTEQFKPALNDFILPAVQSHGRWEGDAQLQHLATNEVIDVRQTIFLVTHPQTKHSICIAIIARDIREQKELEQRKDAFISMASHELRNPLTTIHANLQLAERRVKILQEHAHSFSTTAQKATTDTATMLERGLRQVKVLNRLIGDLLDGTRIQANKLNLSLTEHDIVPIVRETVEDQVQASRSRTILLDIPVTTPIVVLADKDRLSQVINNYLTNALKYSQTTSPVTVGLSLNDQHVKVWVQDQGPGLSSEQQKHVWDRYYQAQGITVQSGSGTGLGLGLHICKTLIQRHGGEVGVESTPGIGSTFWFSLPLAETLYS